MQKRVFIIHGWEGYPEEGWFPWLKTELENRGFKVEVPAMPNSEEPEIEEWVDYLSNRVGNPDKNTYFVGHSIGCQTILRYLETLGGKFPYFEAIGKAKFKPKDITEKIGGAVFVAGWFILMNLETDEEKEIARPWLETPINYNNIKRHTGKFIAIFSDNDPFVPVNNKDLFKNRLNAKIIIESQKGHFSGSDGIIELPSALKSVLEITGDTG